MNILTSNIRYLLLTKKIKPAEWEDTLTMILSGNRNNARKLLDGETVDLTLSEASAIEHFTGIDPMQLLSLELWGETSDDEMLKLNMSYFSIVSLI